MNETVLFEHFSAWEEIPPFQWQVTVGMLAVIMSPKDAFNADLRRLLLGLAIPPSGKIKVFGQEPGVMGELDKKRFRQRLGTLPKGGGLISNLKARENILLPLLFHRKTTREEQNEMAEKAFTRVGYTGSEMAQPAQISLMQRKQISLARAMTLEPELMIYESPLVGLNRREGKLLLDIACKFHQASPSRTTLFLTSDPDLPGLIPNAEVFSLTKGSPL